MKFYYKGVPGLGKVSVSTHAHERMKEQNISQELFEEVLYYFTVPDVSDGNGIIWREKGGVRLVILLRQKPNKGSKLVKTVYRIT